MPFWDDYTDTSICCCTGGFPQVYFGFTLGVTAEVNKKFLAAALGNWLEWYDFGVYAAVPQIIGAHFFASQDPSVQIMQSFMAFAAGYVTRPLGGILIGVVGDRIGRKCALWTSMLLMSLCWSMISSLGLKMPSAKLLEVEPLSPSKYDIYMSQVGKINSWLI